jgi:outer membrane protein assembly factor BamB
MNGLSRSRSFGRTGVAVVLASFALGGCHCSQPLGHVTSEGKMDPSALDFGTVSLGQKVTKTLTIQNIGDAALTLTTATFTGTNAGDFSLTKPLEGTQLQSAQTITLSITFNPQDAGQRQATFSVTTDSTQTPTLTTSLTGVGVDIQICPQPTSLDFGNVQVNGSPVTQQVVFTNCGRSTTTVTLGALEGPNAGDFAMNGAAQASLSAGQTLTVTIAYAPSQVGSSTADVPWTACPSCAPSQPIGLSGVGVDGALTFTPSPTTFGTVGQGQSASATVTATNTGTTGISITKLQIRTGLPIFALTGSPTYPINLTPGQTYTFPVKFTPSTGGPLSDNLDGTWTVADPIVAQRLSTDPLQGNAIQTPCSLTVTPNPLHFGNVSLNNTAARKITVANSGQLACSVTGIALGAGTDPFFALTPPVVTSLTVPPGGNATISVNFHPTQVVTPLLRTGTLVFQSDDPTQPSVSVPMSANINNTIYTGGWPKWHLDNFNSGQTLADTSGLTGAVAWKYPVPGGPCNPNSGACVGGQDGTFMHSPVIDANGNIYFMDQNGVIFSVSSTGAKNWQTQLSPDLGDLHPSTPVLLADGSLYAISGSEPQPSVVPNLYLMNQSNGGIVSSIPYGPNAQEGFSATPAFGNDGTLFEVDDDGMPNNAGGDPYDAICFKKSGTTIGQTAAYLINFNTADSSTERASIVIAEDDTSYWCSGNQCYGMSPPSAGFKPLAAWPAGGVLLPLNDPGADSFTVTSDVAMDSSPGGYFYSYAGWSTTAGAGVGVAGFLVAMQPANGQVVWTLNLPAVALPTGSTQTNADYGNASPAVSTNSTVYVGNGDGLRAVNGRTGAQLWLFKSACVTDAPAIGADGTIFFGTKDGTFYAVNPDGTLRFKVTSGGQISAAPAIANDGTVYFVSDDGFLYGIH